MRPDADWPSPSDASKEFRRPTGDKCIGRSKEVYNGQHFLGPDGVLACKTDRLLGLDGVLAYKTDRLLDLDGVLAYKTARLLGPDGVLAYKTDRLFRRAARNGAKQPAFFAAQPGTVKNSPHFGPRRGVGLQTAAPIGGAFGHFLSTA